MMEGIRHLTYTIPFIKPNRLATATIEITKPTYPILFPTITPTKADKTIFAPIEKSNSPIITIK